MGLPAGGACIAEPRIAGTNRSARRVAAEVISEIPHLRGNIFHDAQTAISMREHGVGWIYTHDKDLRRFPFLEPIDPIT